MVNAACPAPAAQYAEAQLTAGAGGAEVTVQLLPRAPYSARDPAHAPSIGIALERQTGVHAIGSDRREAFDRWPGTVALTPAGVDVFSESAAGGEYLVLRFGRSIPGALVAESIGETRVCLAGARRAFAVAQALRRALVAPLRDDALAADLAWRLVASASEPVPTDAARTRRDRQRYAPVLDRIGAEFAQPLSVGELAAMTDQTPLAFLRGFTAAIGMTPHAYLAEQRLQAARRLLASSRWTLADIAIECGFAHQSHFGNAFKRTFGVTPAHYRRLLGRSTDAACQGA